MTYLPSLIKRIDDFYRLTQALVSINKLAQNQGTWSMPDDEEEDTPEAQSEQEGLGLYSKIVSTANTFQNQEIAEEILLIAELYKKALEINGGYNLVNRALSATLSNIDSLMDEGAVGEEETEAAEDLLNEVSRDLRQHAKTSITQQADEPTAMRELKAVRDAFNQKAIYEEVAAQPSVYEKGKPGAETGHGIAARPAPETPQKYALEIERLRDSLESDPNISMNVAPSERGANQNIRNNIVQLIGVLENLTKAIPDAVAIRDELKITPDDPEKKEELIKASEILNTLRGQRQVLKQRLNRFLQNKELETLETKASQSTNPAERKWLEEKINLQKLRLSSDYNKKTEIKYRKDLINATGLIDDHGDFQSQKIAPDLQQKIQDGIEAGQAKRVSKEAYDRKQTLERAKEHGKIGPVVKRPGRQGGGLAGEKINNYRTELASYSGLVDKLGEKINTATHVARLGVTQEKDKTHNALKPYVDALSKAIQKKDNKAKYEAVKNLKQQMNEWKNRAAAIRVLEKNVRLLPYFNKYKKDLEFIAKWQDENGQWQINAEQQAFIGSVVKDVEKLMDIYRKFYGGSKPGQLELYYDNAIIHLKKVVERLRMDTGIQGAA